MLKEQTHQLYIEIPYSLFVKLKIISMNGRYRGVKEFIKPQTDELVSKLVEIVGHSESLNDKVLQEQVEAGHIAIEQTA